MTADSEADREPSRTVPLLKARREFLEHKRQTQKSSTARAYEFPTKSFIDYCKGQGVVLAENLSKRHVSMWLDARREEVKPITVRNNAKHIRVFLKWMGSRELCEWGIHEKFEIPAVPEDGDVNKDVLRAGHARQMLDYLDTYQYATTYHALLFTMWHTGCRISGAISLDLGDFEPSETDDNVLKFRNRPATGTPLKLNNKSERDVTISDELATVLADYIEVHRDAVTEESGREPLFTTPNSRLYRQRAYKNVVALTRPCVSGGNCPHQRNVEECEAATLKEKAPSCPSSLSNHPIRKGAITNHINDGWPKEALSGRVDVSVDVLEKHYDMRTNDKKRQQRRKHL